MLRHALAHAQRIKDWLKRRPRVGNHCLDAGDVQLSRTSRVSIGAGFAGPLPRGAWSYDDLVHLQCERSDELVILLDMSNDAS